MKPRRIDLFALNMAGYYSLISTGEIPESAVSDFVEGIDFGFDMSSYSATDEDEALSRALSTSMRIIGERAKKHGVDTVVYEEKTVGQIITDREDKVTDKLSRDDNQALLNAGMKLHEKHLCISKSSSTMKKRFTRTKWEGSWAEWVSRFRDQSEFRKRRLRFSGGREYYLAIPLAILDE